MSLARLLCAEVSHAAGRMPCERPDPACGECAAVRAAVAGLAGASTVALRRAAASLEGRRASECIWVAVCLAAACEIAEA